MTGRYSLFTDVLQAIEACSPQNHTPLRSLSNTFVKAARKWAPVIRHDSRFGPDAEHTASVKPNANMIDWRFYAAFAAQIASRRPTVPLQDFLDDAWQQGRRMIATMTLTTDGSRALRVGFQKIFHHFDDCLRHEKKELVLCCRKFARHYRTSFGGTTEYATDHLNATIIVAMVCYDRWQYTHLAPQARAEFAESLPAGFYIPRAFLWAARLLLRYTAPGHMSMSPPDLCARAITGSERMRRALKSHASPQLVPGLKLTNENVEESAAFGRWQDAAFTSLWVEWLISDTEFFRERTPPALMFAGLIL